MPFDEALFEENERLRIVEEDPTTLLINNDKFKTNLNPTATNTSSVLHPLPNNTMMFENQEVSILSDPNYWLHDMEYLYLRSFNELESVFRNNEFRESLAYKDMVLELNSNMIEYKFLHKAGILKAS